MGDITEKLIFLESVLEKLDVDGIIGEAREAHLLTASIKTYVESAIAQATSESTQVGSVSTSLNQLVTPGAGGH